MSILIDQTKRVLVQGITGREGMARTKLMREYGTQVVAGVTPAEYGHLLFRGDFNQLSRRAVVIDRRGGRAGTDDF